MYESLDYRYASVHTNQLRATADTDGRVRLVVAHRDPGAPNWISTAGHRHGTMLFRWTRPRPDTRYPEIETRLVKLSTVSGVPCHQLAARGGGVDLQIWVEQGDRPLPRRVVITYKAEPGQPQFRADLTDWDLAPELKDDFFAFEAAEGAERFGQLCLPGLGGRRCRLVRAGQIQRQLADFGETGDHAGRFHGLSLRLVSFCRARD